MESIDIDGQLLSYAKYGSGDKCVILMHGWGCTHSTVESIARVAAESHTVYSVDFPGFGGGESPEPTSVWGVDDYTRLIEEFARRLNIARPTLIGHSYGGRVGILYASRNPVDKLVLVDAAGVKPGFSLKKAFKIYSFKLWKLLVKLTHSRAKADAIIAAERNRRGSEDYRNASPIMKQVLSKSVAEDLCHVMPQIKAPTLLIWGENDTATPLKDARRMERLIPDAGLVSFPGCGHYSFLDNRLQFAAVLRSFLNS